MDNLQLDMVRNSAIGVALFGVALAPLCARAAPLAEQQYVGNDFSARSPICRSLQRQGSTDGVPPFVILREYGSSGPTTSGAVFEFGRNREWHQSSMAAANMISLSTRWR